MGTTDVKKKKFGCPPLFSSDKYQGEILYVLSTMMTKYV